MTIPDNNCNLCPRLCAFRADNRKQYPEFFNAPVPSFGDINSRLLIVGLAPGLKGANATGRPFTGDYAGLILYAALKKYGFAEGEYRERADDGFTLKNCRVTNAVRCVPPENKPVPSEINICNRFLQEEIAAMPNLQTIVSLGQISHNATLKALSYKNSAAKFAHGKIHELKHGQKTVRLINSYHTSRYNINTGLLTQEMFDEIIGAAA